MIQPIQYARITNQYRYEMQKHPFDNLWPRDGNLGDCMQSLGVENIYQKADISPNELIFVNRDDIKNYTGKSCHLVMQSWFGDYANVFPLPWSDKITPIFIGFHLNDVNNTRQRFIREKIYEKMKPYQPIGCRDRGTRDFLKSLGLDAYFSGCMTLTFDKRENTPTNGKTFIVDLDKKVMKKLPKKIKDKGNFSISHFYYWDEYPVTKQGAEEFEQYARKILSRYKNEANLVITSKIHVAMPCIALGIPVIFITDHTDNIRFDVLNGIIPIYSYKDMRFIDWTPTAADIDKLKQAIIRNAIAQIKGTEKEKIEARKQLEEATNLTPIYKTPTYIRLWRKFQNFFSWKKLRRKIKKAILNKTK